jgi:hypothetical protein
VNQIKQTMTTESNDILLTSTKGNPGSIGFVYGGFLKACHARIFYVPTQEQDEVKNTL